MKIRVNIDGYKQSTLENIDEYNVDSKGLLYLWRDDDDTDDEGPVAVFNTWVSVERISS